MPSLFISYSRRDTDCARKLTECLKSQDLDLWIDWQSIPPTVDWWSEIQKGIEQADAFLFLVSPVSIWSKVCRREIDYAIRNGKRLIPVVVRDVNAEEAPSVLSHLNWIFIRETDDFNTAFEKLITAIKTDYDWVKSHRELQVDALEWERNKHDKSYLLRGTELQLAEFQIATITSKEPHPTDLQKDYVRISRQAADKQRRLITSIAIGVIIALAVLGAFGWFQAGVATNAKALADSNAATAVANAQIARAGELAALAVSQREKQFDLSLLLSVEALHTSDTTRTRNVLLENIQTNRQLVQYLHGYRNRVVSVAYSPDGRTLASGSCVETDLDGACVKGQIILWDAARYLPIGQLGGHSDYYGNLAFSPDGKLLASTNNNSTIILWDVANRQRLVELSDVSAEYVTSIAFSPDGRLLASASGNKIMLWDLTSYQPIGPSLEGYSENVYTIAFSPNGKLLASGYDDGTILLWDAASRKPIEPPLRGHSESVWSLAFSPDGKTLASGSWDETIILWDVETNTPINEPLRGHTSYVNHVAFSLDGRTLVSESSDGKIIFWDVVTRPPRLRTSIEMDAFVDDIAFSPDGKTLASGGCGQRNPSGGCSGGHLILWAVGDYHAISQSLIGRSDSVHSLAFSPDGKVLASGNGDGTTSLWDMGSRQLIGEPLKAYSDPIVSIAFSPDGKILASTSTDATIILWDATNYLSTSQLKGRSDSVPFSLAFSPDGKILASSNVDGTISIWDMSSRQPIVQPPEGCDGHVCGLAFSPDSKLLALGSCGQKDSIGKCVRGEIILWDIASRQPIGKPLDGHGGFIECLTFSRDGKILASGSLDSTVVLWDMETRKPIGKPLKGHSDPVFSIAFSPDGKILASASSDSTIILWDVEGQQPIAQPLEGDNISGESLVFSPDGKILASAGGDGTIILWNLDPASWIERSCQRAGRNLTRAEWDLYFPNEDYRVACPQWPLEPVLEVPNSLQE